MTSPQLSPTDSLRPAAEPGDLTCTAVAVASGLTLLDYPTRSALENALAPAATAREAYSAAGVLLAGRCTTAQVLAVARLIQLLGQARPGNPAADIPIPFFPRRDLARADLRPRRHSHDEHED